MSWDCLRGLEASEPSGSDAVVVAGMSSSCCAVVASVPDYQNIGVLVC